MFVLIHFIYFEVTGLVVRVFDGIKCPYSDFSFSDCAIESLLI